MSHRLLLIRHAKSSWDDPSLPDRERPLTKRGRKAAERVAAHLRQAGHRPDLVLCSPSIRTRETLERLALGAVDAVVEDGLYGANEDDLLARLREVPEGAGTVAVIGHNPGMQDLAIELVGSDAAAGAVRLRERFPTAAVAAFDVKGHWRDLAPSRVRLTSFVVPKDLP
jgi:phosphohistidine phosphatase